MTFAKGIMGARVEFFVSGEDTATTEGRIVGLGDETFLIADDEGHLFTQPHGAVKILATVVARSGADDAFPV